MSRPAKTKIRRASPEVTDIAAILHSAVILLLRNVRQEDVASGIGPAQLSALSVLVFGGGRTIGALAHAEQVSGPTMTRIVDGLVGAGLARRKVDDLDRRITNVSATAKGQRLLILGRDRRVARLAAALKRLDAEQLRSVRNAAETLASLFPRH